MPFDRGDGGTHVSEKTYVFGKIHDLDTELGRLRLLEGIYNPFTIRNLEGTGIDSGWDCLEVGAGPGSIAEWLAIESANRVGEPPQSTCGPPFCRISPDIAEVNGRPAGLPLRTLNEPHASA